MVDNNDNFMEELDFVNAKQNQSNGRVQSNRKKKA